MSAYMGFNMWWRWDEDPFTFPDNIWQPLPGDLRVHLLNEGHPDPTAVNDDEEFYDTSDDGFDSVDETMSENNNTADDDKTTNDDIDNNISNNDVVVVDDDDDDDDDDDSNDDIAWTACDADGCNVRGFLQINVLLKAFFNMN